MCEPIDKDDFGWSKIFRPRYGTRTPSLIIISPLGKRLTSLKELVLHIRENNLFGKINPSIINFEKCMKKNYDPKFVTKKGQEFLHFLKTNGEYQPRFRKNELALVNEVKQDLNHSRQHNKQQKKYGIKKNFNKSSSQILALTYNQVDIKMKIKRCTQCQEYISNSNVASTNGEILCQNGIKNPYTVLDTFYANRRILPIFDELKILQQKTGLHPNEIRRYISDLVYPSNCKYSSNSGRCICKTL